MLSTFSSPIGTDLILSFSLKKSRKVVRRLPYLASSHICRKLESFLAITIAGVASRRINTYLRASAFSTFINVCSETENTLLDT